MDVNSSFFTSGRKFPASNENSKFNANFKGILHFEVKAQALSLFFILTLRNLIPKVFGYEIEHFVLCIEDEHFVEHFAISPCILHPCRSLPQLNNLRFGKIGQSSGHALQRTALLYIACETQGR